MEEAPDQVMPFLENVTRGRGIPRERLESVAQHYLHFGGVSPINGINRALIDAIRAELAERGETLPVYFGNRNWEPFVEDTVAAMESDGIRRAAVFTTSPATSPRPAPAPRSRDTSTSPVFTAIRTSSSSSRWASRLGEIAAREISSPGTGSSGSLPHPP